MKRRHGIAIIDDPRRLILVLNRDCLAFIFLQLSIRCCGMFIMVPSSAWELIIDLFSLNIIYERVASFSSSLRGRPYGEYKLLIVLIIVV